MKGTVLSVTEADDQQFHEDPSKQLVYGEEPALVKLGGSLLKQTQGHFG